MPITSPDSIYFADGTTPASIATITAAVATSVQNAFNVRELRNYSWADDTAKAAQTGMTAGEIGFQIDDLTYYIYSGSSWLTWARQQSTYTPTFTGFSTTTASFVYSIASGVVNVTGKATSTGVVTGAISFTLPSGYNINTVYTEANRASVLGMGGVDDASTTNFFQLQVSTLTAQSVSVNALNAAGTYLEQSATSASIPLTWAASDKLFVNFSYPVA